jgi:hypothetical protein
VPLSEDEQRILDEIEQHFHADDPHLVDEMKSSALYGYWVRQLKLAAGLFAVGVVVLVVSLATAASFAVAIGGCAVMLGATLWFERSLRKLGRPGMERLTQSLRPGDGVPGGLSDRLRSRLHRPEASAEEE